MSDKDLRALLAEAREELSRHVFTQESPACVNCGGESGFDVGRACPYAADRELKNRIDAAIAEPLVGSGDVDAVLSRLRADPDASPWVVPPWVVESVKKIARERDEARAEVEMLRGVGCQTADKAGEDPSGPCGACRKCAYQRGAEAMREAAAGRIDAEGINGCTGPFFGNIIRALPIPEDKP